MSQQGENTTYHNGIAWFILGLLFLAIAWLIWYAFEFEIKHVIRNIRWAEMWVVSWFASPDYEIPFRGRLYNFHDVMERAEKLHYTRLSSQEMALINTAAMYPLRYVYAFILGLFAFWALFRGPETQYRRVLNLDGLIDVQAKNFKVISPFVKFNPAKQPVRPPGSPVPAELPLFAEALGPEEWLAYHQIPIPDGKIDEDAVEGAFVKQLGKPWRGAQNLPNYKKVLLAAFCLKGARKRAESDKMLAEMAECWDPNGGLRLSGSLISQANKVLKNRDLSHTVLSKANRHAFQTTALMRALRTARDEGGVLAPAQFVWLRGYDRDLWYPLNNLGRNTYHMEGIGGVAHYKQELVIDRPIPKPKVSFAVKVIIEYMAGITARPVPQLDYSTVKRKKTKQAPKSAGIKKPKMPGAPSAA